MAWYSEIGDVTRLTLNSLLEETTKEWEKVRGHGGTLHLRAVIDRRARSAKSSNKSRSQTL